MKYIIIFRLPYMDTGQIVVYGNFFFLTHEGLRLSFNWILEFASWGTILFPDQLA